MFRNIKNADKKIIKIKITFCKTDIIFLKD